MSLPQKGPADESWFSRWRRCRDEDPDSPLDVLLRKLCDDDSHQHPSGTELVDIACLDLMQQRRNGRDVCVEDYLRAFPVLDHESQRLDLIDAEMCIRQELHCPQSKQQWAARFPGDIDAIGALLGMEERATHGNVLHMETPCEDVTLMDASAADVEFSVDEPFSIATNDRIAGSAPVVAHDNTRPIASAATPDWFVGQKVFASGPGWWMVRGVHRDTHATYALKIIRLPSTISPSQIQRLREVVSQSSLVNHPNWVTAESSTVCDGHLGVLRPWVHGVAWHDQPGDVGAVVRRLAVVAIAIAGATASGRHHGGVHAENLWIDHRGNVILIDAGSSRHGVHQWLSGGSGEFMSESQRSAWDCEALKSLIASTLMRSPEPLADTILQGIRDPGLSPLQLGEFLLDAADGKCPRGETKSLGARISKFIFRDAQHPS
jgi:hypothetical protein